MVICFGFLWIVVVARVLGVALVLEMVVCMGLWVRSRLCLVGCPVGCVVVGLLVVVELLVCVLVCVVVVLCWRPWIVLGRIGLVVLVVVLVGSGRRVSELGVPSLERW